MFKAVRGSSEDHIGAKSGHAFLGNRGGIVIFLFKLIRLLGTLSLLVLYTVTALKQKLPWVDVALVAALVRGSL